MFLISVVNKPVYWQTGYYVNESLFYICVLLSNRAIERHDSVIYQNN